ncbi:sugar porter family MFS transporter [Kocuria sp.]|uniref:sugar porter family MFS transporter n=1 Tax=Kocuria sp. TaxID=1871328 RepID=UPI0026E0D4A8|nr:sugar porter family MFS transporter [Kocuria sp.]MDO5617596.1 sugar porter family MFS transporter [Kocuria sp.]
MKPIVLRSAIVAALGGLLFGFDTAVISGTTQALTEQFNLGTFALGFTVASALIGTIIGALTAGRPSDRYGRKNILVVIGVLYLVSAIGSAVVDNWYLFIFFRFLGGIGVGGASVTAPIYTAEISPPRLRGRLVGLVQFNVVLGILLAYLSNYFIARAIDPGVAWRWMFGVEALPAAIFILLLFTVPESPRWLFLKGRTDLARTNMQRLATSPQEAAELETEIQDAVADLAKDTSKVRFFVPQYRRVILLAIAIAAFNQLSGINAIMYYAPDIFRMAGAGDDSAFLQSIAVGGMNLIATMVALTVIDKFGRRKLMLIGSIGYLISLGVIAMLFFTQGDNFGNLSSALVLASLLLFIAAHAFGQGSVIWVFISEIFPNRVRARGQALGSFTHWFAAAVISWTFPWIAGGLGPGTAFAVFFVCMVAQLIWVIKAMPETKGVALEEMERELSTR